MERLHPELLLQGKRSGLVELEYYGYIVLCNPKKQLKTIGNTNSQKFFHRSCAKPLQASVIDDFDTKDFYNLTDEEIAVCCASHTGEPAHLELIRSILNKAGLCESDLQCSPIAPLNVEEQKKFREYLNVHNNCSGKHSLMLALCSQNGWDIKTYLEKDHPLQRTVYEKIKSLCEVDYALPLTLDGCGAPNWATTLEEMTIGFWNLFLNNDCPSVRKAFDVNPHLLGGANRLDTQIMQMNPQLKAKVGAGGLCNVVNIAARESLSFKIVDADMKARSIIVIETLIKIGWLNVNSIDDCLLKNSLCKTITTQTGQQVGKYEMPEFIKL